MSAPARDLVIVGDVHLDRDDPAVADFVRFLDAVAPTTGRMILAGDLFELWIGRPEMEGPHHREVAAALARLRRSGVVVRYVEGNRDYRVGDLHAGTAFDEVSAEGLVEPIAGGTLLAVHGDRVDRSDRLYRAWRAISRTRAAWALFHAIPRGRRLEVADGLRRRLGHGARSYRSPFPEGEVRRFAAGAFRAGHSAVAIGHFHVERDLEAAPPSPPGRILLLPEWKGSRRCVRVGEDGKASFAGC